MAHGHPAAGILAQIPPEGPLARSHRLVGGRWCRYDQVWATDDFHVLEMGYDYDMSCSDHALVTASVNIGTADTRQSTARKRRADSDTRVSRGTGRLPGGSRLNR